MAQVSRVTAKSYFNTGDTPTEAQFANFIESAAWFDDPVALTVNGIAPVSGNIVLTTASVADSSNKRYVTDAELVVLQATSGTNTGDQNLSGLMVKSANLSDLTSASTARTNLGLGTLATQNGTFSGTSSGTNTGDEDLASIKSKLGAASGSQDGYLTSGNWTTFNNKQDALVSGTNIKTVNGNSLLGSGNLVISGGTTYTFSTGLTESAGTVTANLATGVSGGQSVIGGTASGNNLTLSSTSNSTKGKLLFGTSGYDEVNNRLGVGTAAPTNDLTVEKSSTSSSLTARTSATIRNSNPGPGNASSTFNLADVFVEAGNGAVKGLLEARYDTGFTSVTFGSSTNHDLYVITNGTERLRVLSTGNVGIKQTAPTAVLHLGAGTATANTAPLKLTSGTNLSTPENGAFEYDGTNLYFTTGGVRKTVTLV